MVIITNMKPVIGDLDVKFDPKMREIHFVRVQISTGSRLGLSLRSMADISVRLSVT